MSAECFMTSPP